ncbi:sensor histidine kinase [Microbispora sp. H10885]|uniref:sensor histidine kinase n=1 Tax=Microbispora sp. H10885 TaxID=2729110 RepID=UPI0016016999|nr:HAMP domain-containing sensor histidine kinase [Microbispora sp. H10885]
MRRRSLRSRLTLLIAAAVALAVAVSAAACWLLARAELRDQIARSLTRLRPAADQIAIALRDCRGDETQRRGPRPDWDPSGRSWQIVAPDGTVCVWAGSAYVRPSEAERALTSGSILRDAVTTDGTSVLVHTTRYVPRLPGPPGRFPELAQPPAPVTISVFRSTAEMDQTLGILAVVFGSVSVLGVAGAAVAGLWLARTALRPVARLTRAVEHVARTEDLTVTIPVEGEDEIARLGRSFNTMTAALSSSQERQRLLVSDAGHELRTPLTSLRTNIDLLLRSEATGRAIEPAAKRRLLANVKEQFEEMSSLVGDLLELSREAESGESSAEIDFHEVVAAAVERARRRGPGLRFDVGLDPWQVHGDARGLQRAAVNVLDNAVKFSPPGGLVTVRLGKGRLGKGVLTVRDEGPGIPEGELPHVFERFWRSPSARGLPGSGLGLAIVAQAVRDAGGQVTVENAPGGGTLATIVLPGTAPGD